MKITRGLSSYEKETIITFNEDEAKAYIFTYNKNWQSHMEIGLGLTPVFINEYGGREYMVSKKRIRPPIARKPLSPQDKIKRAKALEKARRSRILKREKLT
jgi:hypothetical protein